MKNIINYIKNHIVATIIAVAALIMVIVLIVVLSNKTATLFFQVIPNDAMITIGQQVYPNNTEHTFTPGKYTVVISKDGLEEQSIEVDLKGDQTTFLETYLLDGYAIGNGFSYYRTNSEDLASLRNYAASHPEDEKVQAFIKDYDDVQSIQQILPIYYYDPATGDSYSIQYNTNSDLCTLIYCIEISASSDGMFEAASRAIEDKGYSLYSYQLIKTQ